MSRECAGNLLLIVPKSTLGNWMSEIERFTPYLGSKAGQSGDHLVDFCPRPAYATGADPVRRVPALMFFDEEGGEEGRAALRAPYAKQIKAAKIHNSVPGLPIFVTTYEVLQSELEFFKCVQWRYLILDEGHRL